jgi:hypothetical protein
MVSPVTSLDAQHLGPDWESRRGERFAIEIAGAAAGAVGTSIVFAFIGAGAATGGGEDPGLLEAAVGAMAGSVIGSAIGVTAMGRITHDHGKFGSAFLGSAAGFGVFLMMAPSLDADYLPFYLAFWGLPTAGAVFGYTMSRANGGNSVLDVPLGGVRLSISPHRDGMAIGAKVAF